MSGTVVVIPTYNERESIGAVVGGVREAVPEAHIIVVDDGSPDGTGLFADQLAAADPRVHVLHRAEKAGLGAAYRAGFAWALSQNYDVIVEMDADGSHDPRQLPRLLGALSGADLAVGSRWVVGGDVVGWPAHRRLISKGGSWYTRLMLGIRQRDATSGFRAYRADALRTIDPASVASQGYSFQIELLWRAVRSNLNVREVPITFTDRTAGVSKMSWRTVVEAVLRVTGWSFRRPLIRQLIGFAAVGAIGFVLDVTVFNALRLTVLSPDHVQGGPLIAKGVSVAVAIFANWLGNRYWTFRDRRRSDVLRELMQFVVSSGAGGAVALLVLAISHYALGFRSPLADNISANVIGLGLGSVLRFVGYRWWVFEARTTTIGSAGGPRVTASSEAVPGTR
ncbi:hypothetical protein BH09ACT4_BH09ACT4_10330 [soil metagenome]